MADEIVTVERCRHCGCEWVCPDCGGVAGAQPPTETHAPPEVWSGTIDGYRFAVRVEPAEIGPDVAIAVLLQTRAPEIVLDDDHARRVIAVALRDLRRRAGEAERERDRAHEEIDEHASAIERADEMRATVAKLERERDAAKAIADAWADLSTTGKACDDAAARAYDAAARAYDAAKGDAMAEARATWDAACQAYTDARRKLEALGVTL